jgi:hypothetical protein
MGWTIEESRFDSRQRQEIFLLSTASKADLEKETSAEGDFPAGKV